MMISGMKRKPVPEELGRTVDSNRYSLSLINYSNDRNHNKNISFALELHEMLEAPFNSWHIIIVVVVVVLTLTNCQ